MYDNNGNNAYNTCGCFDYDHGPMPFVLDLDTASNQNRTYRTALWTGSHLQTTVMCIPACDEIGLEMHPDTDQFLYVTSGCGLVKMGTDAADLCYCKQVRCGCGIFVPACTWHNVVNIGNCPLKLFAVYAPPHHPHGTVQETKTMAKQADRCEMHTPQACKEHKPPDKRDMM